MGYSYQYKHKTKHAKRKFALKKTVDTLEKEKKHDYVLAGYYTTNACIQEPTYGRIYSRRKRRTRKRICYQKRNSIVYAYINWVCSISEGHSLDCFLIVLVPFESRYFFHQLLSRQIKEENKIKQQHRTRTKTQTRYEHSCYHFIHYHITYQLLALPLTMTHWHTYIALNYKKSLFFVQYLSCN